MVIEDLVNKNKTEQVPDNNKPVNPKWFAGFFILLGLIVLIWALYDSGRLKVPIGTVHDQMGNAIETSRVQSCESDVQLFEQSQSRQRQVYAFIDLFPDVSLAQGVKVILCNGSEVVINDSNQSKYTILSKRHKTYHLISQKSNKNNKKKSRPLQIKHITKIK